MGLVKDGVFLTSEEDYGMKFYENQDLGHQFIDLEPNLPFGIPFPQL